MYILNVLFCMNIVDCLKAALSKGLGLGIIAGSMLGNSGFNILLSIQRKMYYMQFLITLQSRYHRF